MASPKPRATRSSSARKRAPAAPPDVAESGKPGSPASRPAGAAEREAAFRADLAKLREAYDAELAAIRGQDARSSRTSAAEDSPLSHARYHRE